jgi:hypothetical protein
MESGSSESAEDKFTQNLQKTNSSLRILGQPELGEQLLLIISSSNNNPIQNPSIETPPFLHKGGILQILILDNLFFLNRAYLYTGFRFFFFFFFGGGNLEFKTKLGLQCQSS